MAWVRREPYASREFVRPGRGAATSHGREEPRVSTLSPADRELGLCLGLGDLADQDREHCFGFQNACPCSVCLEREEQPSKGRPRQPWEVWAA